MASTAPRCARAPGCRHDRRSSPQRHRRSGALGRPRSRRPGAAVRARRRDAHSIARQAQRNPRHGHARPRDQDGARAIQRAAGHQRPRRRGARRRRRRRACRSGRHGGRGCAKTPRPRRHHRAVDQDRGGGASRAGRADRLCRLGRRLCHGLEAAEERADRSRRPGARHRRAACRARRNCRSAASPASTPATREP